MYDTTPKPAGTATVPYTSSATHLSVAAPTPGVDVLAHDGGGMDASGGNPGDGAEGPLATSPRPSCQGLYFLRRSHPVVIPVPQLCCFRFIVCVLFMDTAAGSARRASTSTTNMRVVAISSGM